MQLQGLVLMLLIMIIMPLMLLFSNDNVFFMVMLVVLLMSSFKHINLILYKKNKELTQLDDEIVDDIEETMNIDIKKFGNGIQVARNMIIILFFIYCSFFVHSFVLKFFIAAIIIHKIYEIINNIVYHVNENYKINNVFKTLFTLLMKVITIIVIAFTACNKFFKTII